MPNHPPSVTTLADHLLGLTRRQAAAAADGDWEEVDALLDQRAPLAAVVAALDPATLAAPARAYLRAALAATIALDRQIAVLAAAAHALYGRELSHLHHGRRTLRAYARRPARDEGLVVDRTG